MGVTRQVGPKPGRREADRTLGSAANGRGIVSANNVELVDAGQRTYIAGNTYPLKDRLREAGAHWDHERKQWWIGTSRRAVVAALVSSATAAASDGQETVDLDAKVIRARVEYQGKTYYALAIGARADGTPFAKLCTRDGNLVFWARQGEPVKVLKEYGRQAPRYGGYRRTEYAGEQTVYPSISSLRAYAERRRREQQSGGCECWCHSSSQCSCDTGFCSLHHDGCDRCGCES